jgi:hypothetical protein
MRVRVCLGVKGWRRVQRMKPNDSQVQLSELHSYESYECLELWLEGQTSTKLIPHDTIRKVLKLKCFKCSHIVHLNLICKSYDQKKGENQIGVWLSTTNTLKANYCYDIIWAYGVLPNTNMDVYMHWILIHTICKFKNMEQLFFITCRQ